MAFLQYQSAWVATGMSPIPIASVGADPIFIDGVTFNSNFMVLNAGQIQILKFSDDGNDEEPEQPGSDFKDEKMANDLVIINLNNAYKKSVRIPNATLAAIPLDARNVQMLEVSNIAARKRQRGLLAMLVDGAEVSDDTTAITSENIKSIILAHRAKLSGQFIRPNVVIASINTYNAMLEFAGKEYTPGLNDQIQREGRIGTWLGMIWVEGQELSGQPRNIKYLQEDGTAKEVAIGDVDFIMYDYRYFGGGDRLDTARFIESELFNGVKAQVEIVTGAKVLDPKAVLMKKKAAAG